MTTATRRVRQPIPAEAFDHGDPKRYRRGCHCRLCLDAITAETRRWQYLRSTGRSGLVSTDRARQHITNLQAAGMPDEDIKKAAQIAPDVFRRVTGHGTTIRYSTEARILAVPAPEQPGRTMRCTDGTGTRRRLRALIALGWTRRAIAARIPSTHEKSIGRMIHLDTTVTTWTAWRVEVAYKEMASLRPEEHDVAVREARRARVEAATQGWAPPAAWDDDTIDDPAAIPDWTGHCGTDRGWWMHTNQRLPMCEACATAHEEWKAKHRVLPRGEYSAALARARAAASSRGVDIAHDGRELMRLGCDYEQAAARLGVTRQHLQQELQRHPERAAA